MMDVPRSADVLAQPTRARLFSLLVSLRTGAGTDELSERVGLHPNGVRRHLTMMRDAGLVERSSEPAKKGRPRDRWMIAPGADPGGEPPTAYADLSVWLARLFPLGPRRLREVERAGREIGAKLAPGDSDDPLADFRRVVTALGFQPQSEVKGDGELVCRLGNCPYRDAVRESADVVCTMHRGITAGLLAKLDPQAELVRFQPHEPERAGCLIEVGGGSWPGRAASEPNRIGS